MILNKCSNHQVIANKDVHVIGEKIWRR